MTVAYPRESSDNMRTVGRSVTPAPRVSPGTRRGHMQHVQQQEFLDAAGQRMQADGSEVSWTTLPGGPALLGYRSAFKVQWMFTKLHTFTFVTTGPVAAGVALERFTEDALAQAVERKGQLRGLQSGVGVVAVLAADTVEPDAIEIAQSRIVRKFGAFAWPAVVDLSTGATYSHQGAVVVGGVYSRWMRKRTAAVLETGAVGAPRT